MEKNWREMEWMMREYGGDGRAQGCKKGKWEEMAVMVWRLDGDGEYICIYIPLLYTRIHSCIKQHI